MHRMCTSACDMPPCAMHLNIFFWMTCIVPLVPQCIGGYDIENPGRPTQTEWEDQGGDGVIPQITLTLLNSTPQPFWLTFKRAIRPYRSWFTYRKSVFPVWGVRCRYIFLRLSIWNIPLETFKNRKCHFLYKISIKMHIFSVHGTWINYY